MMDGEQDRPGPDTTASIDPDALSEQFDTDALDPVDQGTRLLVITRGPGAGSRFVLESDTRIGRHPEAHILLDDVTVSRRHAMVTIVDDSAVLTDQASLNGTYVAGERVDSHVLVDGDEIQIGRFHLAYLEGPSAAGDVSHGG